MAPLLEATAWKLVDSSSSSATYEGKLDSEWLIGNVANGGYSLAVVNVCCQDFIANQLKSTHKDPFHIASTYLHATDSKERWRVDVQVTKRGKGFTNLSANLTQSSKGGPSTVRIQANLIFTDFAKLQADPSTEPITIQPGSKYQVPSFNRSDPKECTRNLFKDSKKMHYWRRLALYRDDKAEKAFRQEGRLSTASYMEFLIDKVPQEHVTHFNNAAITLLPDTTHAEVGLVAAGDKRISSNDLWLPTLFLSIEMKRALPPFPLLKVNSLTTIRHVDHGRFDQDVEIWTHPDDAERLQLPSGVKSVILCISRQVALTIPLTVQATIANKKGAKL